MAGYHSAVVEHKISFHKVGVWNKSYPFWRWLRLRLNWVELDHSYGSIILHFCEGDEERAFDLFFELLDEFRREIEEEK